MTARFSASPANTSTAPGSRRFIAAKTSSRPYETRRAAPAGSSGCSGSGAPCSASPIGASAHQCTRRCSNGRSEPPARRPATMATTAMAAISDIGKIHGPSDRSGILARRRRGFHPGASIAPHGAHGAVPDAADRVLGRAPPVRGLPRAALGRVRRVPLGGLGDGAEAGRRPRAAGAGRGGLRDRTSRGRRPGPRGEGRHAPLRPGDAALDAVRSQRWAHAPEGPVRTGEGRDPFAHADPRAAAGLRTVEAVVRPRHGIPGRDVRHARAPRGTGGDRRSTGATCIASPTGSGR